MVEDRSLSNAAIYRAFVNPNVSPEEIANMSLDEATQMVSYRRQRKVSQEWRDLPMTDTQIAQAVLDCALGLVAARLFPEEHPTGYVRHNDVQTLHLNAMREKLLCHRCGRVVPTYLSQFQKNTGMIIVRTHEVYRGNFCQDCTKELFKACLWHCLAFGWWGIISAFINPFAIIENISNYSRAKRFFDRVQV